MTEVRFFSERGRDRFEEYKDIKRRRPAQAAAIRDDVSLIAGIAAPPSASGRLAPLPRIGLWAFLCPGPRDRAPVV